MTEQTTPAIYAALNAVMKAVSSVAKTETNSHSKYQYRGVDQVVGALGPVFREHGVIVTPNVQKVEYEKQATNAGKPQSSCRVIVDYIFYAVADGSSIVSTVAAEAADISDKATSKAMSVAFRTALLQTMALPTGDRDPDADTPEQGHRPKASKEQMATLMEAVRGQGLGGPENADARQALFADALGRQTNGGDLLAEEIDPILKALAQRGPTAEQEQMLSESLGATPVDAGGEQAPDGEQS